jgi:hypothetical protein
MPGEKMRLTDQYCSPDGNSNKKTSRNHSREVLLDNQATIARSTPDIQLLWFALGKNASTFFASGRPGFDRATG